MNFSLVSRRARRLFPKGLDQYKDNSKYYATIKRTLSIILKNWISSPWTNCTGEVEKWIQVKYINILSIFGHFN